MVAPLATIRGDVNIHAIFPARGSQQSKSWDWKGSSYPPSGTKAVRPKRRRNWIGIWVRGARAGGGGRPGRAPRIKSAHAARPYFDLIREMKQHLQPSPAPGRKRRNAASNPRPGLRHHRAHGPQMAAPLPAARACRPARSVDARHRQPHKTPAALEAQRVELRKTLPTFGARRLVREFDLPVSHGALERIWRVHGLMRKRRHKYQRKQDLAHIKARWTVFQQISADTKDLDDIPRYWRRLSDSSSPSSSTRRAMCAAACSSGLSLKAAAPGQRCLRLAHSAAPGSLGRQVPRLGWQTDNGGEFKGDFPKVLGAQSACAHPARCPHLPERCRNRSSFGRR